MVSVKDAVDERDVYTPPCVMRISDLKQGEGQHACRGTGSGDTEECLGNGNSATGICSTFGVGVHGGSII
jgi:hypothetical protein